LLLENLRHSNEPTAVSHAVGIRRSRVEHVQCLLGAESAVVLPDTTARVV
jgi:hypothetical protein